MARHESTDRVQKRLCSWVGEKAVGGKFAMMADANISALRVKLDERADCGFSKVFIAPKCVHYLTGRVVGATQ